MDGRCDPPPTVKPRTYEELERFRWRKIWGMRHRQNLHHTHSGVFGLFKPLAISHGHGQRGAKSGLCYRCRIFRRRQGLPRVAAISRCPSSLQSDGCFMCFCLSLRPHNRREDVFSSSLKVGGPKWARADCETTHQGRVFCGPSRQGRPEVDDSPVTNLTESSIEIVELEADELRNTQLVALLLQDALADGSAD